MIFWKPLIVLAVIYAVAGSAIWLWWRAYSQGYLAQPFAKRLAQVIAETTLQDWIVEEYLAASPKLGLTLTHSYPGNVHLWFGVEKYAMLESYKRPNGPPVIEGGPNGRVIYAAFMHIRLAAIEQARRNNYREPPVNGGQAMVIHDPGR